jgi:hypothetical protein
MWVKTDKGRTECRIEDFSALEPAVLKVREGYRKACADRPNEEDKHAEKVRIWCGQHFGRSRFNRDYDQVNPPVVTPTGTAHGGAAGVKRWDDFIASKELAFRRWYIDSEVVAGCIMGEDE